MEYNTVGNIKKRIDTANRETVYDYDNAHRLIKVTDANLKLTQFEYNARSQMTKVKDALNQEYVFTYNALGRQLTQTRAGSTMSYEYDTVGNRTKRTDYTGRVTDYTYDNLNRLTLISYVNQSSSNASYVYDDLSRLVSATNNAGTADFSYDNRGRVSSSTDVHNQTVEYGYDQNGNRTSLELNGATHASYVYDAANRLTTLTDEASQNFTFGYDIADRLISKNLPNGISTTYNYDGMSRLTRLKDETVSAVLFDRQYQYNAASQISQIAEPSLMRNFGYDNLDRLTSVSDGTNTTENYGFNEVGNRTASHLSNTYGYQPFNRLTSTATATYGYDTNGNITSKTDTSGSWTYSWDYENRMVSASNGMSSVSYEYDALGRRTKRTEGTNTTKFTYDGLDVVMDDDSVSGITKYQNGLGIDNKLKLTNNGTANYFLTDHLGSTNGLADSSGSLTSSTSYDSFGNPTSTLSTRYQYTGREFDSFTGLHYYRARWYDSNLGRFISEDPIGFAGGDANLFAYIHNNSINKKDPLGLLDPADWQRAQETVRQAAPLIGTGLLVAGAKVGAVVGGGLALGYAIGYYPGQYLANHPSNPFVYGPLNPFGNPAPPPQASENCQPKSSPQTTARPRPNPPPNEPKRKCEYTSSFINAATGKKHCIYRCKGGGFPGFYNIVTLVEPTEACPNPDPNDNDWIPGGV